MYGAYRWVNWVVPSEESMERTELIHLVSISEWVLTVGGCDRRRRGCVERGLIRQHLFELDAVHSEGVFLGVSVAGT